LLFAAVATAGSVQRRVQIPKLVQVEGEKLRLSDLLPPDAPPDLGEICRRINLGNAPLPGSPRVISRPQIVAPLREFPSALQQLEIPDRIIITRKRRRLSAAEILTAIETFMAEEGLNGSVAEACPPTVAHASTALAVRLHSAFLSDIERSIPERSRSVSDVKGSVPERLREGDGEQSRIGFPRSAARSSKTESKAEENGKQLCAKVGFNLQAPVFVTKADTGLEVRRLESDRVQRKTRFLLWTSKEPQVLPFYVTVEGLFETADGASPDQTQTGTGATCADSHAELPQTVGTLSHPIGLLRDSMRCRTAHRGGSDPQGDSLPVVLVVAGEPAKLVVETATLRMTALVTPLQSGVKGQRIRVRSLDTQRVVEAEVVGKGLLQADLGGE
jgi:hypothetical protein